MKTHVNRILAKLGVATRVQAVVLAYETGLVRPAADPPPTRRRPVTCRSPGHHLGPGRSPA